MSRRSKSRATWSTVLILFIFFGSCSLLLWFLCPVSILTCRYVETKQVDCQLQERFIGVIPMRTIPILRLQRSYVDVEEGIGEDDEGREYTTYTYTTILVTRSGEIEWGGCSFGDASPGIPSKQSVSDRINHFLNTPTDEQLTVWQGPWLMILLGASFLVFPGLALVDRVIGLNRVKEIWKGD